jgi:hypothetical protein
MNTGAQIAATIGGLILLVRPADAQNRFSAAPVGSPAPEDPCDHFVSSAPRGVSSSDSSAMLRAQMAAIEQKQHCERNLVRECYLKARDINGVALGMSVEQVRVMFPKGIQPEATEAAQEDGTGKIVSRRRVVLPGHFTAENNGIVYEMSFSPLGRLWFLRTEHRLNIPSLNAELRGSITEKVSNKFGPVCHRINRAKSREDESIDLTFDNGDHTEWIGFVLVIDDKNIATDDQRIVDDKNNAKVTPGIKF